MGLFKNLDIMLNNLEPYACEFPEGHEYSEAALGKFTDELCDALERLTGYPSKFLREDMAEQMEDAEVLFGSPISGIAQTMTVALELDY